VNDCEQTARRCMARGEFASLLLKMIAHDGREWFRDRVNSVGCCGEGLDAGTRLCFGRSEAGSETTAARHQRCPRSKAFRFCFVFFLDSRDWMFR